MIIFIGYFCIGIVTFGELLVGVVNEDDGIDSPTVELPEDAPKAEVVPVLYVEHDDTNNKTHKVNTQSSCIPQNFLILLITPSVSTKCGGLEYRRFLFLAVFEGPHLMVNLQ